MKAGTERAATVAAELLSVQQVCDLLQCSERHVYRLASDHQLPAPVRLGALVRWRRAVLDQWIADGCPAVVKVGQSDGL
ncbi:MAG: helix-turn-helix domain-containing protein [Rhodoglobus sp.]